MSQISQFAYKHSDLMFLLKIILIVAIIIIVTIVIISYAYDLENDFLDTLSCSQILNKINLSSEHREISIIDYYINRCVN